MIARLKKRLAALEGSRLPRRPFIVEQVIEFVTVPYPHTDPVVSTVETTPLKRLAVTLDPGETVVDAAAHLGIPLTEFHRRVAAGLIEVTVPPSAPPPNPIRTCWEIQ